MRYLLVFLLMFSVAYGDDYLDSLQEMSSTVKQNLGFNSSSPGVPDSVVFSKIRESYVLLSNWVGANEIQDTITTTAGVFDYSLDSIIKVTEVFWKAKDSLKSLDYAPKATWGHLFDLPVLLSENNGWLAHSSYYDHTVDRIQFYPIPDKNSDTFIVYGKGKPQNIITDSTFVTQFPVNYRPAVMDYATFKLALTKQMYNEAQLWGAAAANTIRAIDSTIDLRGLGLE